MFEQVFRKTPLLRIGLPYIAGVAWSGIIPVSPFPGWLVIYIALVTLILLFFIVFRSQRNVLSGAFLSILFFMSGHFNGTFIRQVQPFPEKGAYVATLLESPVEKTRSVKAECRIDWLVGEDSVNLQEESVIVYFAKSDRVSLLRPGSRIVSDAPPETIRNSGNPYAFDYRGYMARRGIRRQIYIPDDRWLQMSDRPHPGLRIRAERTRERLISIYRENHLEGDVLEILSALTLGYKKSLDSDTKQVFANTGAMHVLAVSGLHVGIVFLAFNSIFSFLKRQRSTRVLFLAGALVVLWGYAFITGLSPSVQRAALMFSFAQIGLAMRRPVNIYNTISASAVILLVVDPRLLSDVGFQLSYTAVLGIVYFQPKISAVVSSGNRLLNYILGLLSVSVAAQVGTAALSCYYFRQFPVWFWITNLVVIPAAFVLILLGVCVLIFSYLPLVSGFLASIASWIVEAVVQLLEWIECLPGSVYDGFTFNQYSLIFSIFAILALILFIELRNVRYAMAILLFAGLFVFNASIIEWKGNHQSTIIVYDMPEPVVHVIHGKENYLIVPDSLKHEADLKYEVLSVIKERNLHQPVCLGFSEPFTDRLLMKTANMIFYMDNRIALPGCTREEIRVVKPDVWLQFPKYQGGSNPVDSTLIVTPRFYGNLNNAPALIHILSTEGAYMIDRSLYSREPWQ